MLRNTHNSNQREQHEERELYSTECRLQKKKNPDKAKPEPDRQRLSPVARSAEHNNTNSAARLMMTHDGDEEQGHPGHLLWVSLHQAAEHSFPAPHRRRRRHHHVTVHRLAAVLPPMTARWEPPPSMPSVRPPARFVTRPTDEMSREALVLIAGSAAASFRHQSASDGCKIMQ